MFQNGAAPFQNERPILEFQNSAALFQNGADSKMGHNIRIPTEKVGCLQVTSQLQEFLNHFPPESIEKAFEQIYQILQVLDTYLINNPQQHQYCM